MSRQVQIALIGTAMLAFGACNRGERCATCGMKIDPGSAWVSYVTIARREVAFDTPSCAVGAWRRGAREVTGARFREYYSQALLPADGLRFVAGSDVLGPMGPDLVPVAADNAGRFARDHNGAPPKSIEQILEREAP
jgi:copper chaperone NosL